MHKPIAFISDDPVIQDVVETLDSIETHFTQKMQFLSKQADQIKAEYDQSLKAPWEKAAEHFRELNKLPKEYDAEKNHFHYNKEDNLFYYCDGNHGSPSPILEFIKQL